MNVKHAKSSGAADGADPTAVHPSDWNADHIINITATDVGALPIAGGTLTGFLGLPPGSTNACGLRIGGTGAAFGASGIYGDGYSVCFKVAWGAAVVAQSTGLFLSSGSGDSITLLTSGAKIYMTSNGTGIGTNVPTSKLHVVGLATYANNAAAIAAGHTAGAFYAISGTDPRQLAVVF